MRVTAELRAYRSAIDLLAASWKHPHHGRCGRCRALSFMALLEGDTADLLYAKKLCDDHAASGADLGMPKCRLEGCALHERLPFALARRLLRIEHLKPGAADWRGRKVATIDVPHDGAILVEFTRSRATAHVWVDPPLIEEHEVGPLEALARGWDEQYLNFRDRCLARYRELLDLAKADLDLEPATTRERRAPFRRTSK